MQRLVGRLVTIVCCAVLVAACTTSAPDRAPTPSASRTSPATMTARERQRVIVADHPDPTRGFSEEREFLTMRDGVRLAVSYFMPDPIAPGERLPVVLSATPYRKDDQMLTTYYDLYPYFAKRGIVVAHVDIRGSGASDGRMIDREYADAELDDLEQVIAQLAAKPWSNGNVGMMGKSWAGFNAIMTAMRRPPALKAILVADASQDLYRNDIHYIDGILHYDIWALEMEADAIAPRYPEYELDAAYFRDRFDRPPWTITYLRHQRDGDWWQRGRSLQSDWGALDVPVYAIGGLQDGYRDYVIDLLDHAEVPIWAEVGPWAHYWPHDGWPSPQYEWRQTAVRWWQRWLTDDTTWPFEGKTLTVYRRRAQDPSEVWWRAHGRFEVYDWPVTDMTDLRLVPQADHSLADTSATQGRSTHRLRYRPGSGIEAGGWWGDVRGDIAPADENALVYDTPELTEPIRLFGTPEVQLAVSADAAMADWIVRLEDVWPDGEVHLVTGAAINGAQRDSTTSPAPLVPGQETTLRFPLHFMTYTFPPGHRVRLVVTNAQFPMLWPTPHAMTTTLRVGGDATFVDLPTAPPGETVTMPNPVEPSPPTPGVSWPAWNAVGPYVITADDPNGITRVAEREGGRLRIHGDVIDYLSENTRWVDNTDPARAGLVGHAREIYELPDRTVTVRAKVEIVSDARYFHVTITRRALVDGHVIRRRVWSRRIPRDFQ